MTNENEESMSEASTAEIAKAISGIMAELESLPKDGHNAFSNYEFTTEGMIANTLRPMMAKAGLALVPFNSEITQSEQINEKMRRVTIAGRFKLIHSSGESINIEVPGEGMDSLDKSTAKALTQSYKYALLQIFCAGRGEDGDAGKGYEATTAAPASENAAVRQAAASVAPRAGSGSYIFTFGKHNGEAIVDVPMDYLDWLAKKTEEDMKDPAKSQYKIKNKKMIDILLVEKMRRAQNASQPVDDDSIPF